MCHFVIHFGEAFVNQKEFRVTRVPEIRGNNLPQTCLAFTLTAPKSVEDISSAIRLKERCMFCSDTRADVVGSQQSPNSQQRATHSSPAAFSTFHLLPY